MLVNDQNFSWKGITSCVPQGSIFGSVYRSFERNSDLAKIREWSVQWKMSFHPDPTKLAQEIIFSRNLKTANNI